MAYLQDVQFVSFAGQTARFPFEKVPSPFIRVLLRSMFSVGSLFDLNMVVGFVYGWSVGFEIIC